MSIEETLRAIANDLRAQRCRFALVGGLAVSVRGEPRTTRDVDVAIAVAGDAEAEAIVRGLLGRGYRVVSQLEHETGRLATVRLRPPRASDTDPIVDLLFASSGIEVEVVEGADSVEIVPGLGLPIARRDHLIAMKVLSHNAERRAKDRLDVLAMLREVRPTEIDSIRMALHLIAERGYGRQKDLPGEFESMLCDSRSQAD